MNLQPLNVCMSYQGSLNIIERISEDHDIEIHYWSETIANDYMGNETVSFS